jgi:hypothetical protein
MEAKAIKKGGPKDDEVRLVEHRRAHNLLIELSGIRKPFGEIKVGGGMGVGGWVSGPVGAEWGMVDSVGLVRAG